jgi:hypothetical protein
MVVVALRATADIQGVFVIPRRTECDGYPKNRRTCDMSQMRRPQPSQKISSIHALTRAATVNP